MRERERADNEVTVGVHVQYAAFEKKGASRRSRNLLLVGDAAGDARAEIG